MKLSTKLQKQAKALAETSAEFVAVSMLKQAGLSEDQARMQVAQSLMEKSATESLVMSGMSEADAMGLVKSAGVQVKDLAEFSLEKTEAEVAADFLTKAAGQVLELEAELEQALEKIARLEAKKEAQVETPEYIQKLASSGDFTNEDLEAMMKLPQETLTKVAAASEQPWTMGKAAGLKRAGMDPLTEFLMS